MADEAGKQSSSSSPPPGKMYEHSIHIPQAQRVSLLMAWMRAIGIQQPQGVSLTWVKQVRGAVAGVGAAVADAVARLRSGRPPYTRSYIIAVAEELKADPSRESQRDFIDSVSTTLTELADPSCHRDFHRNLIRGVRARLEAQGEVMPEGEDVPGYGTLWKICGPIYKARIAKK